jgi:hypothetical protein
VNQTIYTWRKRFGMFQADDVLRLKQLEAENARLGSAIIQQFGETGASQEVAVHMVKQGSLPVWVRPGPTSREWGARRRTEWAKRLVACILAMRDPPVTSTPI